MKLRIKRFGCILAIFAIFTLYSSTAFSAVPEIINYQGSLSDAGGNPVNATLNITFTLYDVDAGLGNTLWQEVQVVTVTNGQFSVELGADGGNPLPALLDDPVFLGVQVDADAEMTPRQKFTSTAFALRAKTVENDTLNSLSCAANEIPKFIGGVWVCAVDDSGTGDITGVTVGNGLTGGGVSGDVNIAADTNVLQSRVNGTCPAGQSIRVINANGTVTCEVDTDTDTNTTYSAGSGLSLSGTLFSIPTNGITASQLAANSVGTSEIATSAVGTSEVQNNSLTANDLAPGAVGTSEVLNNSLTNFDLFNEPGVEFLNDAGVGTDISVTTTWAVMRSLSITAPSSGFVTCIAAGAANWDNLSLTADVLVGWDTAGGTIQPDSFNTVSAKPNSNFDQRLSITAIHTFSVSPGTTTFSLKAQCGGCLPTQMDFTFHSAACMFFPTRY